MKYFFILLSALFFIYSCNINNELYYKNKLELILQIEIPYSFKILKHESDFAIGDQVEIFKLKFKKNDYFSISKSIDLSKMKKKGNLYYKNYSISEGETISIILNNTDYTIQYSYADL